MKPAPRGAGLVRRALILSLATAFIGTLVMALALRPEVSQGLERIGWSIGYEARLGLAALLTLLPAAGLAALLFGGADRDVRTALAALEATDERPAGEEGLKALTGALVELQRRVRAAEAARERVEAAARGLAEHLDAAAQELGAGWPDKSGGAAGRKPPEYEDEALRRLAAAAEEAGGAARRVRGVMVTLLARVMEDLAEVDEPLAPVQETLAGMGRVIDDLVATYPTMPSLKSLQVALGDCGADVARARQAAELVEREVNAIRRRMGGGTLERLTSRDLVPRDAERTPEGTA